MTMRLFDETKGIKHSWRLMQPKQLFYVLLAGLSAVTAYTQTEPPATAQPPPAPSAQPPPAPSAQPSAPSGQPSVPVPPAAEPSQPAQPSTPAPAPENPTAAQPYASPYVVQTNNTADMVLSNALAGPGNTRKIKTLTLDECIRLALQHNLDIQIQQLNPTINQYLLNVNYGTYEPVFSFTAEQSYFDRAGGLNPQTGQPFTGNISEQETYSPDIKGSLPTGLTYDLSGASQRNAGGVSSFSTNTPFWNSDFNIQLSQPLLKNFWIDNNRLQIQLSKATLKISEQALRLQVMTTVTAVRSAYYNLLYARGNVDANATAYKLAEELVSENVKRVQVGSLAPLDEKQSESQAATSLATVQSAEQALIVDENTLKNLLTDNYSEWAETTLMPAEQLVAVPQELNLQESWRRGVTQRPELLEAKLKVEQKNITLKYDFNQIFPELDVIGSYGRNAHQDQFSDTLDEIRRGNHSSYTFGASVTFPLGGNYGARNTYKSDKATLKQQLLTLKQTEQGILMAIDNDVGSVRSSLQQVDATRNARIYAEDALDAEKKKLENGKSTSFIVLQLISNLTTAKVAEIQALANYNIAVSQLALDEGSTLDVNHIDLKLK